MCFEHLIKGNYRYAQVFHNGYSFAFIAWLIEGPECVVHTEVKAWSHNIAKTMLKGFYSEFFPYLKDCGVKKLAAFKEGTLETDRAWCKFIKMFGFQEPINCMYSERVI